MKDCELKTTRSAREVVLASNEESRDAHKALYHFAEELYLIVGDDLLESIAGVTEEMSRVHITVPWTDLISIATWKTGPSKADIFFLLTNSGVDGEELRPFKDSDAGDIFPWLYYGKRLNVLRKICRSAKTNVEKHLKNREARVYCHLVSEDTKSIVASSL